MTVTPEQIDQFGLCEVPVTTEEIKPELHDEFGFDHSDGPGPEQPVADENYFHLSRLGATSTPLTGAISLLRAAGIVVIEVPGASTRSAGSYGPWIRVLNHHTAGGISSSTLTPSLNVCIYGRSDLSGPLCNFYGGRDLKLYFVSAGRANHAGSGSLPGVASGNGNMVGIEWENNGVGESWTRMMPMMVTVNAVLLDYLRVSRYDAYDHKEWAPTRKIDRYGISPSSFRSSVAAWRPGTPVPVKPPVTTAPKWPGRYLKVGVTGTDVKTWQGQMSKRGWTISVDGSYGPQSESVCKSFQQEKHLSVDGIVGQDTWDAAWSAKVT